MSPLLSVKFQAMLDQLNQFYSKQDEMKIYEAMNTHQLYSNQELMNPPPRGALQTVAKGGVTWGAVEDPLRRERCLCLLYLVHHMWRTG